MGGLSLQGFLRIRVVNPLAVDWRDTIDGAGFQPSEFANWPLMNSVGSDTTGTITRWNQVAGSWSIASNLVTAPATVAALMTRGHPDWKDGAFTVRFKWVTGASPDIVMHCDGTDSNWIGARVNGTTLFIDKVVNGVSTNGIVSTAAALTNNTFYWLQISAVGTAISVAVFNDSAGKLGSAIASTTATVSDASVQKGIVGLRNAAGVSFTYGGAFSTVCTFTGPLADGWSPVTISGEPIFAMSDQTFNSSPVSISIKIDNSADAGALNKYVPQILAGNNTLSGWGKTSSGGLFASITAGGVTIPQFTTVWATTSATGPMTAPPVVSCQIIPNGTGTAYFDDVAIAVDRAVGEITTDLPHLHAAKYSTDGFQPGNPGSNSLGTFSIDLYPPGTAGFAKAQPIYDLLDYAQRVEFYLGYSPEDIGLGKLVFGGIITSITKRRGKQSSFQLSGVSDLFWLNYNRPFPGELLTANYGSGSGTMADYRQARHYFASNEPGWMDDFTVNDLASYISANAPSLVGGSWSYVTDDGHGVPAVSVSTGTGAALIASGGIGAQCQYFRNYVEISGFSTPTSTDATNAGGVGVGLTFINSNGQNSAIAWIRAKWNASSSHFDLDVIFDAYVNGALTRTTASSALTSVEDAESDIHYTIQFHGSVGNLCAVTVNGKAIFGQASGSTSVPGNFNPGTATCYPFFYFVQPSTGTAVAYFESIFQLIRFSEDINAGIARFKPGNHDTPAHSLPFLTEPGPTFLEIISRAATQEGWYWRYTPQPFVVGVRTIGSIDFMAEPGTNRSGTIFFDPTKGNIEDIELSANADQFATATSSAGTSGTDGGGISSARSVANILKYGVIEDQTLAVIAPNFNELRSASHRILSNKITLGPLGSKKLTIVRNPEIADQVRELDKILVNDPEMGIDYLVCRVLGYTFEEAQENQEFILDQFHQQHLRLAQKRAQQALWEISKKFGNR